MFQRLFARRRNNASIAHTLYGAIVAQAREPSLYREFGVPDTLDGRFDMIVLHAFLFLNRMKTATEEQRQLGQDVFDAFLKDMDRNLREMGVSDIGVPKRLKKMAQAFYGRVGAYDSALSDPDPGALAAAIARNVFPGAEADEAGAALASYCRAAASALANQPVEQLLAGRLEFPPPDRSGRQVAA